MITRNFNLFLNAGKHIPLVINVNQYDHDEQWCFTLLNDNGEKYIPSTGAIVGIKADRLGIINSGTVNASGQVVINETEQMTAAVGKAVFELVIDDGTHGTANFVVLVEEKPGNNADLSETDISMIEEAIEAASTIKPYGSPLVASTVAGMTDHEKVYVYVGSETGYTSGNWYYWDGSAWTSGGVYNSVAVQTDTTLTFSGVAADAKKTGDEISDLKSQINNSMPQEVKLALDAMLLNMVVKDDDVFRDEYNTIHAWATAVTLNSISATFNQGDNVIFSIDSLDTLKQYLTVTANYSDGTSATITSYELSGTLTAGESTITATYSGKFASFTANVTEGTDVTPALSGFTAGSGTQVTYNSSDESLNVKTTTNSTYLSAGAGSDLTFKTGYTYRLLFDVVAVSGTANHMLAFRNSSSQIVTETRTEFASVGTYQKDVILSECVRLEGQTTCRLFVFAAANTSGNGDVTIKNLKLIEYLAGE